ncbi:MAG: hypothetical protein ACTSPM_12940, partial [Candidatus Heimdallarchaeota archaeon]
MPEEIPFDLTEIFPNIEDSGIDKAFEKMNKKVDALCKTYQKKIRELDAQGLLQLLKESEEYYVLMNEMNNYAGFSFYGNMTDEKAQQLYNKHNTNSSLNRKKLTFIQLEIGSLLKLKPELLNDPMLENYKHYLEKIKVSVPHRLSEIEEQLIIEKDQYGVDAWEELRNKWA